MQQKASRRRWSRATTLSGRVSDKIGDVTLKKKTPFHWFIGFGDRVLRRPAAAVHDRSGWSTKGIGIWGTNQPVGWAFPIINFVWWIGIGHAGTLISAILLLLNQKWRTSINRFAEAMTLFAVAMPASFRCFIPAVRGLPHTGCSRIPNTMGIWPQFRQPSDLGRFCGLHIRDRFAPVLVYRPDPRSRDASRSGQEQVLSNSFTRSSHGAGAAAARHWHRYELAYLILAGISTPLVLSVHSIVSLDFAVSQIPGWHATFFPPYFVAGAIYAGFAMVLILCIPLRHLYNMKDFITHTHLVFMGKVMLATGFIVVYGYAMEAFFGWYGAFAVRVVHDQEPHMGRPVLVHVLAADLMQWYFDPVALVQAVSRERVLAFLISIIVSIGMWLERFVIIVTSLHRDFLPSSWGMYSPTIFDITMFVGTLGFFFTLIFLFVRFLPVISIFEVRTLLPAANVHGHAAGL